MDRAYRRRAREDLPAAFAGFDLSPRERRAIAEGDVGYLLDQGVHPLLLVRLQLYGIAGLTEELYSERIRARGTR